MLALNVSIPCKVAVSQVARLRRGTCYGSPATKLPQSRACNREMGSRVLNAFFLWYCWMWRASC